MNHKILSLRALTLQSTLRHRSSAAYLVNTRPCLLESCTALAWRRARYLVVAHGTPNEGRVVVSAEQPLYNYNHRHRRTHLPSRCRLVCVLDRRHCLRSRRCSRCRTKTTSKRLDDGHRDGGTAASMYKQSPTQSPCQRLQRPRKGFDDAATHQPQQRPWRQCMKTQTQASSTRRRGDSACITMLRDVRSCRRGVRTLLSVGL